MSRSALLAVLLMLGWAFSGHAQDSARPQSNRPPPASGAVGQPAVDEDGDADMSDGDSDPEDGQAAEERPTNQGGARMHPRGGKAAEGAAEQEQEQEPESQPEPETPAVGAVGPNEPGASEPAFSDDDTEEGSAPAASAPAPAAPAAVGEPVIVAPGVAVPNLKSLAATRERPLFSPNRRPPPPPPEAAEAEAAPPPPPPPPGPPPFDLAGVITGGDADFAMLRNRDTQTVERAKSGETLEGWTLTEIGPRYVVLKQDERSVRLALFEVKEGEAARRPAVPPASIRRDDEEGVEDGVRARQRRHAIEMRRRQREAERQRRLRANRGRSNNDDDDDE